MEKTTKTIIGLLIAVLVLNWFSHGKLSRTINELKEENRRLRNEIAESRSSIQNDLTTQMKRLLNENQSNIDTYGVHQYNSIDINKKIVGVKLNFSLKSSENIRKVKVGISTEGKEELTELYAETENGIHYTVNADLSYLSDYSVNIYGITNDGDIKKLNAESFYCGVKNEFENRTQISDIMVGHNNDTTDFAFAITNNTFGYDGLKIKDVKVEGMHGSFDTPVIKTPKEFENEQDYHHSYTNNNYSMRSENASEAIEEARKETYHANIKNEYETKYYKTEFPHSELGVKIKGNPHYNFKIIITYQNGEMIELDH
ncbi:MAG: LapA family protein [Bacteroidales bacterium]|jgi:hypothetical protein|nr:LapA family protein [Bacteroidales bacterium]